MAVLKGTGHRTKVPVDKAEPTESHRPPVPDSMDSHSDSLDSSDNQTRAHSGPYHSAHTIRAHTIRTNSIRTKSIRTKSIRRKTVRSNGIRSNCIRSSAIRKAWAAWESRLWIRITQWRAEVIVAEHCRCLRSPLRIGHTVRSIRETPMFVWHDWTTPFVDNMHVVRSCAALNGAPIVAISTANQVALIRCQWFNRSRVLFYSHAGIGIVRVSRSPGDPVPGARWNAGTDREDANGNRVNTAC